MDKAKLLKARLEEAEVEIEGVGTVRVRALSRAEALTLKDDTMAADVMERRLLTLAMVDPVLSEDEVKQWQASSPAGELEPITEKIASMSGMKVTAAKESAQRFRGKS